MLVERRWRHGTGRLLPQSSLVDSVQSYACGFLDIHAPLVDMFMSVRTSLSIATGSSLSLVYAF